MPPSSFHGHHAHAPFDKSGVRDLRGKKGIIEIVTAVNWRFSRFYSWLTSFSEGLLKGAWDGSNGTMFALLYSGFEAADADIYDSNMCGFQ
jgi:hypothetical protein